MATMLTDIDARSGQAEARADRYAGLRDAYAAVRAQTVRLCEPLATEDYVVQSMADVSPTKWHLAHTSWFFETFVLKPHAADYVELNPTYAFLFNSYYMQAGERHCRAQRGYISRPTVAEVFEFREYVDAAMDRLLAEASPDVQAAIAPLVEIGLHHEQQHQELLLTDIKHVFSVNPLRPVYRELRPGHETSRTVPAQEFVAIDGGLYEVGHDADADDAGFAYDNESPRHRVYLEPYSIATRLVTNGEYLAFMEDDGYARPELWLSMGWAEAQANDWSEPFYWERRDGEWWIFTLNGMRRVDPGEPVAHLSYYEADAYARWAGARLPTEPEWEVAAMFADASVANMVDGRAYHPRAAEAGNGRLMQMYGDVWEWTQSQYTAYPGYRAPAGALGEYNGKFMCNQFVLRGGSCATPASHIRRTYRNFFPPEVTWQFTGLRLAKDGA